jgi:hypothetical protein
MELVCAPGQAPVVTVAQRAFRIDGDAPETTWSVPVCVRFDATPAPRTHCEVLSTATASFTLEPQRCPRWILPNPGGAGHYWSRLPPAQLRALLDAPGAMDAPAKLELLATQDALRARGDIPIADVLDVYQRLANDPSPHVAARVAESVSGVERSLVTDASRPRFTAWVTRTFAARARQLGFTPRANDTEAVKGLRRAVVSAVGTFTEDPWVHAEARRITARWLADPAAVDAESVALALPIATRHGDAAHFDALLAALGRVTLPQDRNMVVGALTAFDDPALVRRALELSVDAERLRAQDLRTLLGRWSHRREVRAAQLAWMRERFDAVKQARGRNARWLLNYVGITCDDAETTATADFLSTRITDLEGSERGLRESRAHAAQCARTRARYADDAARWLAARR